MNFPMVIQWFEIFKIVGLLAYASAVKEDLMQMFHREMRRGANVERREGELHNAEQVNACTGQLKFAKIDPNLL